MNQPAKKPPAKVTTLDDYRKKIAGVDPKKIIGSILWFSIAGTAHYDAKGARTTMPVRVKPEDLEQWFDDLGLDPDFLPPPIKAVDSFRRATSEVSEEFDTGKQGVTATLMVREVAYDNEQVVRHIVKETKDSRGKKLSYEPQLATLKFLRGGRTSKGLKGTHTVKTTVVDACSAKDRPRVEGLIKQAMARYDDLYQYYHADALRAVIRNYVTALNAIAVKPSGGVYFVHTSRQTTVDALHELVKRIGQGCSFHQLPLLDTTDQREMLTDAFQTEVEDEVRLLLKEIAALNDKYKSRVPVAKYADLNARYQNIVERSEEYTRVLGLAQGRAGSALELALDGVVDMSGRLDIKK